MSDELAGDDAGGETTEGKRELNAEEDEGVSEGAMTESKSFSKKRALYEKSGQIVNEKSNEALLLLPLALELELNSESISDTHLFV